MLAFLDGRALDNELVHLPVSSRVDHGGGPGGNATHTHRLSDRFSSARWWPETWPTLCGLRGYTFVYDGAMIVRPRGRRLCGVCRARVKVDRSGTVALGWNGVGRERLEVVGLRS